MGVIMHNNISYGGGSTIEPNPQESATDQLETLGIDGDVYEVTDANAIHTSDVGVANGVAELDANGFVPSSQLPSYVDDVLEYASRSAFPATGETGKIYVALDTNLTYRWGGSDYVEISPSLALGETSSTAYRGDRGKIAYDHSQSDHSGIKPAFTEASTRANIASGDTLSTMLGKIKKFFSDLKTVAFSGSYNDLTNKPTLATVATSGSYNDLSNKPTIPTVNNGTLTIQKNGTQVATFSANQSGNATANIECAVPSDVEGSKVATGNPLTITDAAGIKAEKIEIGFDPKQDKHGYNSVWVGGAGKNKFYYDQFKNASGWTESSGTYSGSIVNLYTYAGYGSAFPTQPTWKASTRYTVSLYLLQSDGVCRFRVTYTDNTTDDMVLSSASANTYCTMTTQSGKTVSKIAFTYNTGGTLSFKEFQIEEGTSRTTWNPYENISPITGYTSLSADRCGKNLYDSSKVASQTLPNGNTRSSIYFNKLNGTYTISRTTGENCYWGIWNGSSFSSNGNVAANSSHSITITSSDVLWLWTDSGKNMSGINNLQVEKNPSATTYDPFKGDSVTIQLGQTLYGGKLTILQDGSADVDVTHGILDLGTRTWIYQSTYTRFYVSYSDMAITPNDQVADAWCSGYNMVSANDVVSPNNGVIGLSQSKNIIIRNTDYTDPDLFKASLNGITLAYPLASPFTIHLSPVETLTLLQGINNVWTDGTTLSLTYQPDNAIGQAKGMAQDAMAMVNALASTAVKVIAKKGQYDMSINDWVDMPDCSLSLDKGTYVIIGWLSCDSDMLYYNGHYYRYGCAICDSSNNRLVCNTFLPSDTTQIVYGGTISTFYYEKITSDATVRKLKGYMPHTVSGSKIAYGGIVAIKIA